jgi:hypothetical protein
MAPAIPSYARTFGKTVVCAFAGLANLTAQICLTCCPRWGHGVCAGHGGLKLAGDHGKADHPGVWAACGAIHGVAS